MLTCHGSDDDDRGGSHKACDSCGNDEDFSEKVVQIKHAGCDQPKRVCMPETACKIINDALESGEYQLPRAKDGSASPVKHSYFRNSDASECDEYWSDDDVKKELGCN